MGKAFAWFIGLALLALVLYALFSGLPHDVQNPWPAPRP